MSAVLTPKGLSFRCTDPAKLVKLKKRYTIAHEMFKTTKIMELWSYIGDGIYTFPRFAMKWLVENKYCDRPTNFLSDGKTVEFESKITSTENQEVAFNHVMKTRFTPERIAQGVGGGIIQMGTGRGKTYLSLRFMKEFKRKTLIVVPRLSLFRQWEEVIIELFPAVTIGRITGEKAHHKDGDIVLSTIQSIIGPTFRQKGGFIPMEDYIKDFGFIILDEIHWYCTPAYKKVFQVAQCKRTLGVTATANDRNDPFDRCAWDWYGKPQIMEDLKDFKTTGTDFKTVVRRVQYYGLGKYTRIVMNKDGVPTAGGTINLIMKDPDRKKLILRLVKEYLEIPERNIYLIFEHRDAVKEYARELGEVDAPEVGLLMGGVTNEQCKEVKTHARVIVCTYSYITTGISIVRMNTIILGTPRKSNFKQLIGRIRRLGSDEKVERIIVDVVDSNTFLARQWHKRRKIYDDEFNASYEMVLKEKVDSTPHQ